MARLAKLPLRASPFRRAYRLVPSRFPPAGVFDQLAEPDELDTLHAIEARTNDRLREDLGAIELVAPADRIVGKGTTPVMAAFTHPNPDGSRFSPGHFGVYYCADRSATAIRESAHHRARFLRLTNEPPCRVEMRQYIGDIRQPLHDGTGGRIDPRALDPDDYTHAQAIGQRLRDAGAHGIAYPSVRDPEGLCAALFRPPAIGPVRQSRHFAFLFDGERIADVVALGEHTRLA